MYFFFLPFLLALPIPTSWYYLRDPRLAALDLVPHLGMSACSVRADCYTRWEGHAAHHRRSRRSAQGRVRAARPSGAAGRVLAGARRPESEQVKRLVEELANVDSRITAESYNFVLDKEKVESLGIRRSPAIAVMGAEKDYGIRMYGLPSGYEFGTLVEAILDVSSGDSGLSDPTRAALKEIMKPVHVQVFSTPT